MDQISKGSKEEVWIKTEPFDDGSFYIKSEDEVRTVQSTSVTILVSEAVSIKSEIQIDGLDCITVSPLPETITQFNNKETKKSVRGIQQRKHNRTFLECDECGKKFNRQSNLNRHKSSHKNKEKLFGCVECRLRFYYKSAVIEHMKSQHPDQATVAASEIKLSCEDCGKQFKGHGSFQSHRRTHIGERLTCDICAKTFRGKSTLTVHMRSHSGSKPYSCDLCGMSFVQSGHLHSHKLQHTGDKNFPCDACDAIFARKKSLKYHQQSVHSDEKPFICETCGKAFVQKCSLEKHRLTHTGIKPFECNICGMRFAHKYYVNIHKQTHIEHKPKPFTCEDCGKTFGQKSTLKVHKLTHSKEKRFECNICGARFALKCSLTTHNLTHTGERRFPCEQCDKGFTKQCHLDTHKLQHSGERPFKCEQCGKGFTLKFNLKTHKLKHIGLKPFACDECSSRFGSRSLLNQHKRIHGRKSTTAKSTSSGKPSPPKLLSKYETQEAISDDDNQFGCNIFDETSSPTVDQPTESVDVEDQLRTHAIVDQPMISCHELGKSFADKFVEMHQRTPQLHISQNLVSSDRSDERTETVKEKRIVKKDIRHLLVEKPFACTDCEQKFITPSRLRIHQRTHSGENRFVCDECGRSFNRKDSLFKHQKCVHAGARRFFCDICGMGFFEKGHLNVHMKRHAGMKSICCDECPARFVEKSSLLQHKRHAHRNSHRKKEVLDN